MAEKPEELTAEEKHRLSFLGLVLFLRQMAAQLVEQNQIDEARGLIDSLESVQVKTKGNLVEEEERLLESVLFELRMAVVKGPPPEASPAASTAPSEPEPKATD
jgi:hypothetical protein